MNGRPNPDPASFEPSDEREEIARLLPAPADWDLPRGRHLHHKDLLMRHIDRDQATTPTTPAPATAPAATASATTAPAAATAPAATAAAARPGRRRLRPVLLAPVTALALAGIVTAAFALNDGDRKPAAGASSDAAADMQPVSALLGQISDAAGKRDTPTVRDDQFSYVREKVREADLSSGKAVVGPLHDYELWLSQDPEPVQKQGLIRSDGKTMPLNAEFGDTNGTPAGFSRPTYQWLASLPTDPGRLLDHLYAKAPQAENRERDQAVFEQIGDLLDQVMPARTAAALYRAAAKIPGVTETPRAQDAVGRRGLGIARSDTKNGVVTEWVFSTQDFTYLGHSTRLTKDTPYAEAGTLLDSSALLKSAVVDKPGRLPGSEKK
ncbi:MULTISPECIES: CU044_5270 family protein [Streptomyces]|uniref:CU044_5270 family protein n=1 Tax=Streptomyces TaxID=1883 RepID=UPI0029AB77D8|nr:MULTISPECIES: CU044_5270 family protein [Streptomyces]MDX3349361.1 CU044_5270 family protein [Streptomyces sp. ME02-6979A]